MLVKCFLLETEITAAVRIAHCNCSEPVTKRQTFQVPDKGTTLRKKTTKLLEEHY